MTEISVVSRRRILEMAAFGALGGCNPSTVANVASLGFSSVLHGAEWLVGKVLGEDGIGGASRAVGFGAIGSAVEEGAKAALFPDVLKELRGTIQEFELDQRLAIEAATVVGSATIIDGLKGGYKLWYQDNHSENPINEFTFELKNNLSEHVGGDVIFSLNDIGMHQPPLKFNTDVLEIPAGFTCKQSYHVKTKNLEAHGKKDVQILSQPKGVTIKVSKVMILPMSPTL